MKSVDCKNVSREIDELNRDQQPSLAVLTHTEDCVRCRNFYYDRLKLRQIVGELPTVSAPADFDFRLRARLASEKRNDSAKIPSRVLGFGFPSVALASIALLVGATLSMRALIDSTNPPAATLNETPRIVASLPFPIDRGSQVDAKAQPAATSTVADDHSDTAKPELATRPKEGLMPGKGNRRRSGTGNSRSKQAPHVNRDELIAGAEPAVVFPLEASEPLRVSVDYATGRSRTISLPTLSFGSQEVVSSGASQMIKTAARTVW